MRELPTGTVTLLFTDVEGSTELLHELGPDAYADALAEHRRRLRGAFSAHGGVEVDTQGDAFFYAFADAREAVAAASDAHAALDGGPVLVRTGIHTGTPKLGGEGYVGADVHLAARIAAAGHGGQILLSQATYGLVGGAMSSLGEHRLKDFDQPVRIYQLGSEHFAPLRTISNTNLPRPASSFVGRELEVAEITALLRDGARLLTLTGPGGTGKTRLSIEAATELVGDFKSGVFWVPVASLRDSELVTETIARTLGAKDGLAENIGERDMLLLVDNLEQVVEAAPALAALVERCPNLRLMTTSRELLRVRGEVEYPVPPLADRDAVELFLTRSHRPVDDAIAELCARLDNLPLAVELAAARASVLTPAQILGRLSGRLDLLKGGRDADPRQLTLRAAIEWSYDLLDEREKGLFNRFSVFAGGATLEAAESVVAADVDTLQGLVDKSLIRHGGDRFWMLETIRQFAADRLASDDPTSDLPQRHASYFLERAEALERSVRGPDSDRVGDDLERDHANYRAALDHLEAMGDFERAMRLAGALGEFWDDRAHHHEARTRYSALLAAANPAPTPGRAKVLDGAAQMAMVTGDAETAWRLETEALDAFRALGDKGGIASALWGLGYMRIEGERLDEAAPLLREAAELFRELRDDTSLMWITRTLAFSYSELGELDEAWQLYGESRQLARAAGNRVLQAHASGSMAWLAARRGARTEAIALEREALESIAGAKDPTSVLARLVSAAGVFAQLGQLEIATQLLSHAEAGHVEIGAEEPWVGKTRADVASELRERMTAEDFDRAWNAGRTLTREAAFELAFSTLDHEEARNDK